MMPPSKERLNGLGGAVAVANGIHYGAGLFILAAEEIDFGGFFFNGFQKLSVQPGACSRDEGIRVNGLSPAIPYN